MVKIRPSIVTLLAMGLLSSIVTTAPTPKARALPQPHASQNPNQLRLQVHFQDSPTIINSDSSDWETAFSDSSSDWSTDDDTEEVTLASDDEFEVIIINFDDLLRPPSPEPEADLEPIAYWGGQLPPPPPAAKQYGGFGQGQVAWDSGYSSVSSESSWDGEEEWGPEAWESISNQDTADSEWSSEHSGSEEWESGSEEWETDSDAAFPDWSDVLEDVGAWFWDGDVE